MTDQTAVAFASNLSGARKTFSLYPPTHPRHEDSLSTLLIAARNATAAGPFTLNMRFGRLYRDSAVLPDDAPGLRSLATCLAAHQVESITFFPGLAEHDLVALIDVLGLRPGPDVDVGAELQAQGVVVISVQRLVDETIEEAEERERQRAQDHALYARLVGALRQLVAQTNESGTPDLAGAATIVEGMLGRFMEDSAAVLGLATNRSTTEADLYHALNTMIYALGIGAGLGLSQERLAGLGVSALMHDIGKVAFDRSDTRVQERLRLLHPRVGAEILARVSEGDRLAMLVAYEHHMGPNGRGWPESEPGFVPHPYSRMVAVADRYDRLTMPAPEGAGLTPDRAVVQLLRETQSTLDLTLTRVFVREMGVFPVGCMVRLSDLSVGIVCAPGKDPLQPKVRLVYGPDGLPTPNESDLDLDGSALGIMEIVQPDDLRETVSEHL